MRLNRELVSVRCDLYKVYECCFDRYFLKIRRRYRVEAQDRSLSTPIPQQTKRLEVVDSLDVVVDVK